MDNGSYMFIEYGVRKTGDEKDTPVPAVSLDRAIEMKKHFESRYREMFGLDPKGVLEIVKREVSPFWDKVSMEDISR